MSDIDIRWVNMLKEHFIFIEGCNCWLGCRRAGPVKAEGEGMAVEGDGERGLVTRRHLSLDSTRDSGIGDGSNSSHSAERHMSVESEASTSLAHRLPGELY